MAVGQILHLRKKNKREGAQQVMNFITAKLVPSEMSKSKTMGKKAQNERERNKPSILPRTLFTAPTQPSHDIPTLRTTVCTKAKIETSNQKQWKKINIHNHSIKPYSYSIMPEMVSITQHDLD